MIARLAAVGILAFDDPLQPVAVGKHQPAVAARIGLKAQHDHIVTAARREHRCQRLGPDERRVAVEHHRLAGETGQRGGAWATAWPVPSCSAWHDDPARSS